MKHFTLFLSLFFFFGFSFHLQAQDTNNDGYHDDDVAVLEKILADHPESSLTWSGEDYGSWSGVTWDNNTPKRVNTIDVSDKHLSGTLNMSGCTALTSLKCNNNNLCCLDVKNLIALSNLECYNNYLIGLDLSSNTSLTHFYGPENNYNYINIQNGNNQNLKTFVSKGYNCLICIQVDDVNTFSFKEYPNKVYCSDCNFNEVDLPLIDYNSIVHVEAEDPVYELPKPTMLGNNTEIVNIYHNTPLPITKIGFTTVTWFFDYGNGVVKSAKQYVVINKPDALPIDDVIVESPRLPSNYQPCVDRELYTVNSIAPFKIVNTNSEVNYTCELVDVLYAIESTAKVNYYPDFLPDALVFTYYFQGERNMRNPLILKITNELGQSVLKVLDIVYDIPDKITGLHLTNNKIKENNTVGETVGKLTAFSAYMQGNYTYSIKDNALFTIDDDKLIAKDIANYEINNNHPIEVTVTSKGGCDYIGNFNITIEDVNDAPSDIQLSNATLAENTAVGTLVGTLSASDEDANQTFTYTIAENNDFIIDGNRLLSKAEFDYEAQNSYSVEITVTDQGNLSHTQSVTIQVEDENEAPSAIQLSNATIAENSVLGTEIGVLTTTDTDADQTFTYTLTDNEFFKIEDNQLLVKGNLNYEAATSHDLEITVTDQGGLSHTQSFTIQVEDGGADFIIIESEGNTYVAESGSTDSFTVVLDAQPSSDVVLNIVSRDESEITLDKANLIFTSENWDNGQTVTIIGLDDTFIDGNQISTITVSVDDMGSDDTFDDLADQTISCTTTDDEEAGFTLRESNCYTLVKEEGTTTDQFTVVLDDQPVADVVLSVYSGDTGEATVNPSSLTFTNANWETAQTVTVTGVDDVAGDGSQVTPITISVVDGSSDDAFDALENKTVNVTTVDNDSPGITVMETNGSTIGWEVGKIDTLWVTLNSRPLTNVVLSFASSNLLEMDIEWYEYTFTPDNWDEPHDFLIAGLDDECVDGDRTIALTIGVVDEKSDNTYDHLDDIIINAINIDNEIASFTVSKPTASVDESGTGNSFAVILNAQPVSDVVFDISNSDKGEVSVDKSTLTFTTANWNYPQTINFTGVDDYRIDGNQSSTITVSVDKDNSNDAFDALSDRTVSVTTFDNDIAGLAIVESDDNSIVDEAGASDSFTVALSAQPDSDVVIKIANGDSGELSVTPANLTFTTGNWDSPQTVNLSGEDDLFDDDDQSTFVTLSVDAANSDDSFDLMSNKMVNVITADDDASPVVTASQSFSINETAINDASVGTVLASDADAGTTFSNWTITGGNVDGIFAIDPISGVISIVDNTKLDFETTTSYTLSVTVSDCTNISAAENVTVNINPVNDNIPIVIANQSFSINENAANNTSVGSVLATDADEGTVYSNWDIFGSTDADGIFGIDENSGEIKVLDNTYLDAENKTSYLLQIRVSDGDHLSAIGNVTINVNDLNDNAPIITANQVFHIQENKPQHTLVGIIDVSDLDVTPTTSFTFSWIGGNTNSAFVLDPNTGEIRVNNPGAIDSEVNSMFELVFTSNDGVNTGGEETISIFIDDVNEFKPIINTSTFAINENTENNTIVGKAIATDNDVTTNLNNWVIVSGNSDAIFAIEPSSGVISIADNTNLDFETTTSYTLSVTVSDGTNQSTAENVTITINNINEVPTEIQLSNNAIVENAASATEVGRLTATDVDANQVFTYSLKENENFEITGDKLISKATFDYEAKESYDLEITVTDQGSLNHTQSFTIEVEDINEAPVFISEPVTLTREEEEYVYNAQCVDVDADGCSLFAIEKPKWLTMVDNGDGTCTLSGVPNQYGNYKVILEARDQSFAVQQEFEIEVEVSTGIDQVLTDYVVNIYPNPVVRELHIDLSEFRSQELTVSLYSLSGSLIFKEEHQCTGGEFRIRKSVQHLRSGIYLLVLESESYRKNYKIVKN